MPKKPNKSYFYILSGRVVPVFLVDENGDPGRFDTAEAARECADRSFMSRAIGYIIIEMDDNGPVGEVT